MKTLTIIHRNNQSTSLRRVKTLTTSSQKEARPKSAFLLDRSSSLNPAWRHSWKDDASLSSTPSSPSWNTCTAFTIVCLRPSPLFFLPCFLLTARADHWSWLGWGQRLRRAETAIRWRHVIGRRLGLLSDSCISAVLELRATSSSWSVTDMSWLWTGITQENDKFVISALDTGHAATLSLSLSLSLSHPSPPPKKGRKKGAETFFLNRSSTPTPLPKTASLRTALLYNVQCIAR